MIHKAQSAPSIPSLEANQQQTSEAVQEGDAGIAARDPSITTRQELSFSRAAFRPKTLLKPLVSHLPCLPTLPSMPSLRPNLSIVTTQLPPTAQQTVSGTVDSGWEGDTEDEDDEEYEDEDEEDEGVDESKEEAADDDEEGRRGPETTSPLSPVSPGTYAPITHGGGRELQSCLRHSSSSKSKKSNKVTFSLTSSINRKPSTARERGGGATASREEESETDRHHKDDGGDSGEQSSSPSFTRNKKQTKKKGTGRRRRNAFLTSLTRPLRSPLLLLSSSSSSSSSSSRAATPSPKPVRIFLEAMPCPNKDPSIRSSYPHALFLDLNDLVSPLVVSASPSNTNHTTTTTTTTSNNGSNGSNAFIETLESAARQALFYADEVLYAPLKQNRYDGAATPVPWNDARLRDLARFWLQPEDGWEVLFRCEVLPWLGWFHLEDGKMDETWWDKGAPMGVHDEGKKQQRYQEEDSNSSGGGSGSGSGSSSSMTNNLITRTLSRKGKGVAVEAEVSGSGSHNDGGGAKERIEKGEGNDDDDEWVCFSRKNGVMRIDLVVKFGYRPSVASS